MLRWHCHPILRLTTLSYQIISQLKNYFNFIHHPGFYVTVKVENTAATFNISGKHPSHLQRSAAVSVVIITLINYTHVIILSTLLSIVVSTQQARNGSTVHRMQHLTWYCVALSREMRLLEAAWGGQNEESSCWLGDKLRLCEMVRLGLVYTIWIIPRGPLGTTIWYTLTQNSIFMQTIFHPVRCLQYKVPRSLNPDIFNIKYGALKIFW